MGFDVCVFFWIVEVVCLILVFCGLGSGVFGEEWEKKN